ncbi:MAG: hypothetical protein KY468_02710 [Armatimonadetes bacterium]|nr:hypothetical protein [Armatimonadota bacterium]
MLIGTGLTTLIAQTQSSGIITTFAGGGFGDGGQTDDSGLYTARGIAADPFGNVYVSDASAHRVRKIEATTGIITTFAGSGLAGDSNGGFSGDNSPATAARLNNPRALLTDDAGNVYIGDVGNGRIRKVDPSGTITTVAGGGSKRDNGALALEFGFGSITDMEWDPQGHMIVNERDSAIWKIDKTTRAVTLVAAGLSYNEGVAVGKDGAIYVARGNGGHNVYKIPPGGTPVRIAGQENRFGYTGDGGLAIHAQMSSPTDVEFDHNGNLLVTESTNHVLRLITPGGYIFTAAGGDTSNYASGHLGDGASNPRYANMWFPSNVAVDPSGNRYVTMSNGLVYKIAPTGKVTVIAGKGMGDNGPANNALMRQPHGLATAPDGGILITDRDGAFYRIRKVGTDGRITTLAGAEYSYVRDSYPLNNTPAARAPLAEPRGIAADLKGNIYFVDTSNKNLVRKIDYCTGNIVTVAGTLEYHGATGTEDKDPLTHKFYNPSDVAVDQAGNVYIAEHSRIFKLEASTGKLVHIAGNGNSASPMGETGSLATEVRIYDINGITIGKDGQLYVAAKGDHRIVRVDPVTKIMTSVAGVPSTDYYASGYAGEGGPATAARIGNPYDVALDADGNVFIAASDTVDGNGRVLKVDAQTKNITSIAGGKAEHMVPFPWGDNGPAKDANIEFPFGLTIDRAGNLYVTDAKHDRIRKVSGAAAPGLIAGQNIPATFTPVAPAITGFRVEQIGPYEPDDVLKVYVKVTEGDCGFEGTVRARIGSGEYAYFTKSGEEWVADVRVPYIPPSVTTADLIIRAEDNYGRFGTYIWPLPIHMDPPPATPTAPTFTAFEVQPAGPYTPGQQVTVIAKIASNPLVYEGHVTLTVGKSAPVQMRLWRGKWTATTRVLPLTDAAETTPLLIVAENEANQEGRKEALLPMDRRLLISSFSVTPSGPFANDEKVTVKVKVTGDMPIGSQVSAQVEEGPIAVLTRTGDEWSGEATVKPLNGSVDWALLHVTAKQNPNDPAAPKGGITWNLPIVKNPVRFPSFRVQPAGPYTPGQVISVYAKVELEENRTLARPPRARIGDLSHSEQEMTLQPDTGEWMGSVTLPEIDETVKKTEVVVTAQDNNNRTGEYRWEVPLDHHPINIYTTWVEQKGPYLPGQTVDLGALIYNSAKLTKVAGRIGSGAEALHAEDPARKGYWLGKVKIPDLPESQTTVDAVVSVFDDRGRTASLARTLAITHKPVEVTGVEFDGGPYKLGQSLKVTATVFSANPTQKVVARNGDGTQTNLARIADTDKWEGTITLPTDPKDKNLTLLEVQGFSTNGKGESVSHTFSQDLAWAPTVVHVTNDSGGNVSGARIYINGASKGSTNGSGNLELLPPLISGTQIVARKRVHENATSRGAHDGWNYRVYNTSVTVNPSGSTSSFTVDQPAQTQEIRVSRSNALIGMHLRASMEWDATQAEMEEVMNKLTQASQYIYNATDGQFFFEEIELEDDAKHWDDTDFRIFANKKLRANAWKGAMFGEKRWYDGERYMNQARTDNAVVYAHEFGHWGLDLNDEYKDDDDNIRCTALAGGNDPQYGEQATAPSGSTFWGQPRASCMMWHQQKAGKLCSGHPNNPHVTNTRQGAESCWATILRRFSDSSGRWVLQSPDTRGAIVGPIANLPVFDWEPTIDWVNISRTGLRGSFVLTFRKQLLYDLGFKGAFEPTEVYLKTSSGRDILLGETDVYNSIRVVGAHAGDKIRAGYINLIHEYTVKNTDGPDPLSALGPVILQEQPQLEVEMAKQPFELFVAAEPTANKGEARLRVRSSVPLKAPPTVTFNPLGTDEQKPVPMALEAVSGTYVGVAAGFTGDIKAVVNVTAANEQDQIAVRTSLAGVEGTDPERDTDIFSADGQVSMTLPAGALPAGSRVALGPMAATPPLPPAGHLFATGVYQITSSGTEPLARNAMLRLQLPRTETGQDTEEYDPTAFRVLRYNPETRAWETVASTYLSSVKIITAELSQLGVYTLAAKPTDPMALPILKGDLNDDKEVNVTDAITVLRIAVNQIVATDRQKITGDMDDNGMVNVSDATKILRKAVGLD